MIRIKNNTPARLPSEYQEVEYLESTGTQYINTGVAYSNSNSFQLNMSMEYTTVDSSYQIMGFSPNAGLGIGLTGSTWWEATSVASAVAGTLYNIEWYTSGANHYKMINSTKVSGTHTNVSLSKNMLLFAVNPSANDTSGRIQFYCKSKLYSAKINVNGVLVRDYVPCYRKSDNVAGLYDLVNNVFYTNAGSGTFLIGNEVEKRDLNINPAIGDKPLIRAYVGDKLVYGVLPSEQLVNYTMLYDRGDECTAVTGGILTAADPNGSVSKNADYIYIKSYRAMAYTNNKIDLSAYDRIFANVYTLGRAENLYAAQQMAIASEKSITQGTFSASVRISRPLYANVNYPTAGKYIFDTDINYDKDNGGNNAKGNYYIGIIADDSKKKAYINLYHFALIKNDDWQTLASIAGITASTIEDVLTNSDALLSNENAVEFMIKQCTGSFMVSAIQSSTFLTALNNSAYNTKIQANEHWNKFLSMVA